MRIRQLMREILQNICIICSMALLAVQVLDWYNPFMDFMGHSMFLLYLLCTATIVLGADRLIGPGKRKKKKNPKRNFKNYLENPSKNLQ